MVGLGLDAGHDDAAVLARDLVAAVRTGAPGVAASIVDLAGSGGSTLGTPFVEALLDELEGSTR